MANWVLITGASAGIGRELSRSFAAGGFDVLLAARNRARLDELSVELKARYGVETRVAVVDLAARTAPQELFGLVQDIPISVLVNNAGFGWQGAFAGEDPDELLEMVEVNVTALVQLTRLLLPSMLARAEGRILNVASTAAFQPGPFTAMYYATKAFVFSFSMALAEELRGTGVTVTTLCPGFTRTEFHERAQMKRGPAMLGVMSAEKVARIGYRGCMRGKALVVPGVMNKLTSFMSRRMPARFTARIVRRINGR